MRMASSFSTYTVDGLDLDLQEALAAAVDAAQKAGRIIWGAAQRRRAAVAAAYAPTALPKKPPTAGSEEGCADASSPQEGATAAAAVTHAQDSAAAKAISDLLRVETKSAANDLVTYYDKRCNAVIMSILQQYVDRVNQSYAPHTATTTAGTTTATDSNASTAPYTAAHGAGAETALTPTPPQAPAEHKPYPFRFITEELSPDNPLTDDLTWIVDPIDGTLSFVHGLPDCCVSIGLTYKKVCILAVVFCPFLASSDTVGVMQAAHAREGLGYPTGVASSGAGAPPHPAPSQQHQHQHQHQQHALPSTSLGKRTIPQPPVSPTATAPPPPPGSGSGGGGASHAEEAGVSECVGELFIALKGKGFFVNGVPARVHAEATAKTAMAVFNFPHSVRFTAAEEAAVAAADTAAAQAQRRHEIRRAKMDQAVDAVGKIRRQMCLDMLPGVRAYGSAVTTLALLAAGRIDLYVEPSGKVWDVVCGSLMVQEAGGCVRNLVGEPFDMSRDTTIAAGATEALVAYVTDLCVKHKLGQFYLV